MSQSIIVTVIIGNTGMEADMELSSDIKTGVLEVELLKKLKNANISDFFGVSRIHLYCNNRRLNEIKTLTENNIYDGSVIVIDY